MKGWGLSADGGSLFCSVAHCIQQASVLLECQQYFYQSTYAHTHMHAYIHPPPPQHIHTHTVINHHSHQPYNFSFFAFSSDSFPLPLSSLTLSLSRSLSLSTSHQLKAPRCPGRHCPLPCSPNWPCVQQGHLGPVSNRSERSAPVSSRRGQLPKGAPCSLIEVTLFLCVWGGDKPRDNDTNKTWSSHISYSHTSYPLLPPAKAPLAKQHLVFFCFPETSSCLSSATPWAWHYCT